MQKLKNFSAKSLKDETALVAQSSESSSMPRRRQLMSHEFDDDIEHLYNILRQYRSCERAESCGEIITNIRLNGYRTVLAGNASAEFGVLFLDHPHVREGHWQEACIQICHTRSSTVPILYDLVL